MSLPCSCQCIAHEAFLVTDTDCIRLAISFVSIGEDLMESLYVGKMWIDIICVPRVAFPILILNHLVFSGMFQCIPRCCVMTNKRAFC